MDIFKVYATGQKTRKDGTKAIARKRWIASFLLETDAHVYAESVRRYNPTWQVEIRFPNVNYDVPSTVADPKDDGSCDPLYGNRMDSADCGEKLS